jgi:hypothetical protein
MLVSEKFFKKSIRESIYVSIREIFEEEYQRNFLRILRRVPEKAFICMYQRNF